MATDMETLKFALEKYPERLLVAGFGCVVIGLGLLVLLLILRLLVLFVFVMLGGVFILFYLRSVSEFLSTAKPAQPPESGKTENR